MPGIMNAIITLNDNKSDIAILTLISIISMFVFRDVTTSVLLALVTTSPYFIRMLNSADNTLHIIKTKLLKVLVYILINFAVLALSIIPSWAVSEIVGDGISLKFSMIASYSVAYCLIAPYLYKIATGAYGRTYKPAHYAVTMCVVGVSELVHYSLDQVAAMHTTMTLIAAPLICLSYVMSLYLITIINLIINGGTQRENA